MFRLKIIASFTLFALLCGFTLFYGSPALAESKAQAVVGQKAPGFTLSDTYGNEHSLSDYQEKIIVLEWTNHGCPYVQKYYNSGRMQDLQQQATDQGVIWLTINSSAAGKQGYTTPEEANALIAETGAAATARLLDPRGVVGRLYGAKTTPHMYVIDKSGTLVYAGAIDDRPTTDPASLEGAHNYVMAALQNVKAEKPVDPAITQAYGCSVKYSD